MTPSPASFGRWQATGERRLGGSAEVLRAVDPSGRSVAIKVARDAGDGAAWLRRELETLQAIAKADPHAAEWSVALLDSGTTADGRPWIVLPWYPGSLRDWISRAAPPLEQVLDAMEQAAVATWRLHGTGASLGQPRLHGDLKPDNFLVDATSGAPRVVIADFGGARAARLATPTAPVRLYTPRYAPIEQALGVSGRPDPSIDTHALAVTLYWCLTGTEPESKAAPPPTTAEGDRLLQLQAGARTPAEEAERASLTTRPLAELVHVDEMEALRDADRRRLRNQLADELRGRSDAADPLAEELATLLGGALADALHPDPRRRDADLRKLASACELARTRLVAAGIAAPLAARPPPPPPAPPPPVVAVVPDADETEADPVGRPLIAVLVVALLAAVAWAVTRG